MKAAAKPSRTRKSNRRLSTGKRAENKEKTRRDILRAALELFSKQGFYATTTKQISQRAKIAEGTLFNYFRTKEDLALYFFEEESNGLMEWYQDQKHLKKAALSEKLFALVYRHLERIAPYEDFIGAVYLRAMHPVSKLSPLSLESQELSLRYLKFVREILREAQDQKEIPDVGDLGAYGFGVFHMAMISYWLNDKSPNKENTLALLDRSLKMAGTMLRKGGWEW